MQKGRVVVVKIADLFVIGSVTSVVETPEVGLNVQFKPEGDETFFSKASGAVHKIRDFSIEKLLADYTGVQKDLPVPQEYNSGGGTLADDEGLEEEEDEGSGEDSEEEDENEEEEDEEEEDEEEEDEEEEAGYDDDPNLL